MKPITLIIVVLAFVCQLPTRGQVFKQEEKRLELKHTFLPDWNKVVLEWEEARKTTLQYADTPAGPWQPIVGAHSPYETSTTKEGRYYRLGPGIGGPDDLTGNGGPSRETFSARAESNMGVWSQLPDSDWMFTKGTSWTRIRSGKGPTAPKYRSMSGNFLVEKDNTPVAIFFSAEAYVVPFSKRMFVRAKVDGQVLDPADVVFTAGTSDPNPETRSFIFTQHLDAGLHTLEMEWLVDRGATGYIRDAAFLIRQGESGGASRSFIVQTPPSGPQEETLSQGWSNVPGLSGSVKTDAGDSLVISVSAESYAQGDAALYLRALVDGAPAEPSDVLFAKGDHPQCRMMTFGIPDPAPGVHNVQIQWLANGGGLAFVGDRSLVLAATSARSAHIAQVFVAPPSGPQITTSSTKFAAIPGMVASGPLPINGEVAVLFSGEAIVPDGESMFLRLTIDGIVMSDADVEVAESHTHVGVHSHVFSVKHINYPGPIPAASKIRVEWRTQNGKTVQLGDRTMTVLVKRPTVPDLAEPIPFGGGNSEVEAAIGTRHVLAILFDPGRPDIFKPNLNNTKAYLFGPVIGLRDYYTKVSGGKYAIESALGQEEVLGWYDGTNDYTAYFNGGDGCDGGAPTNGLDRRRMEAIKRASNDFNFAAWDHNGDGVLDPQTELAILLILPDDGTSGTPGKVRSVYDGDCKPLKVDGVIVPLIAEWLTNLGNGQFMVAVHEMAHLLLNLDDSYVSNDINTRARRLSLMDGASTDVGPHIDPLNKMALGWVTPKIVTTDGNYSLKDVKKSQEVIILPRLPGDGLDEYYILENRQDALNYSLYDKNLDDSGIAIWHVVEGHGDNKYPPVCQDPVIWADQTDNWNARRGNRVLRPQILCENETSLWHSGHYDVFDNVLVCPILDGGNPANRRNVLRWSDGTPSGYGIMNWSAAAETMTFQVLTP